MGNADNDTIVLLSTAASQTKGDSTSTIKSSSPYQILETLLEATEEQGGAVDKVSEFIQQDIVSNNQWKAEKQSNVDLSAFTADEKKELEFCIQALGTPTYDQSILSALYTQYKQDRASSNNTIFNSVASFEKFRTFIYDDCITRWHVRQECIRISGAANATSHPFHQLVSDSFLSSVGKLPLLEGLLFRFEQLHDADLVLYTKNTIDVVSKLAGSSSKEYLHSCQVAQVQHCLQEQIQVLETLLILIFTQDVGDSSLVIKKRSFAPSSLHSLMFEERNQMLDKISCLQLLIVLALFRLEDILNASRGNVTLDKHIFFRNCGETTNTDDPVALVTKAIQELHHYICNNFLQDSITVFSTTGTTTTTNSSSPHSVILMAWAAFVKTMHEIIPDFLYNGNEIASLASKANEMGACLYLKKCNEVEGLGKYHHLDLTFWNDHHSVVTDASKIAKVVVQSVLKEFYSVFYNAFDMSSISSTSAVNVLAEITSDAISGQPDCCFGFTSPSSLNDPLVNSLDMALQWFPHESQPLLRLLSAVASSSADAAKSVVNILESQDKVTIRCDSVVAVEENVCRASETMRLFDNLVVIPAGTIGRVLLHSDDDGTVVVQWSLGTCYSALSVMIYQLRTSKSEKVLELLNSIGQSERTLLKRIAEHLDETELKKWLCSVGYGHFIQKFVESDVSWTSVSSLDESDFIMVTGESDVKDFVSLVRREDGISLPPSSMSKTTLSVHRFFQTIGNNNILLNSSEEITVNCIRLLAVLCDDKTVVISPDQLQQLINTVRVGSKIMAYEQQSVGSYTGTLSMLRIVSRFMTRVLRNSVSLDEIPFEVSSTGHVSHRNFVETIEAFGIKSMTRSVIENLFLKLGRSNGRNTSSIMYSDFITFVTQSSEYQELVGHIRHRRRGYDETSLEIIQQYVLEVLSDFGNWNYVSSSTSWCINAACFKILKKVQSAQKVLNTSSVLIKTTEQVIVSSFSLLFEKSEKCLFPPALVKSGTYLPHEVSQLKSLVLDGLSLIYEILTDASISIADKVTFLTQRSRYDTTTVLAKIIMFIGSKEAYPSLSSMAMDVFTLVMIILAHRDDEISQVFSTQEDVALMRKCWLASMVTMTESKFILAAAVALEVQPNVAAMLIQTKADEEYEFINVIMKLLNSETKPEAAALMKLILTIFDGAVKGKSQHTMLALKLRDEPDFWSLLTKPLFVHVDKNDKNHCYGLTVRSCILQILALEWHHGPVTDKQKSLMEAFEEIRKANLFAQWLTEFREFSLPREGGNDDVEAQAKALLGLDLKQQFQHGIVEVVLEHNDNDWLLFMLQSSFYGPSFVYDSEKIRQYALRHDDDSSFTTALVHKVLRAVEGANNLWSMADAQLDLLCSWRIFMEVCCLQPGNENTKVTPSSSRSSTTPILLSPRKRPMQLPSSPFKLAGSPSRPLATAAVSSPRRIVSSPRVRQSPRKSSGFAGESTSIGVIRTLGKALAEESRHNDSKMLLMSLVAFQSTAEIFSSMLHHHLYSVVTKTSDPAFSTTVSRDSHRIDSAEALAILKLIEKAFTRNVSSFTLSLFKNQHTRLSPISKTVGGGHSNDALYNFGCSLRLSLLTSVVLLLTHMKKKNKEEDVLQDHLELKWQLIQHACSSIKFIDNGIKSVVAERVVQASVQLLSLCCVSSQVLVTYDNTNLKYHHPLEVIPALLTNHSPPQTLESSLSLFLTFSKSSAGANSLIKNEALRGLCKSFTSLRENPIYTNAEPYNANSVERGYEVVGMDSSGNESKAVSSTHKSWELLLKLVSQLVYTTLLFSSNDNEIEGKLLHQVVEFVSSYEVVLITALQPYALTLAALSEAKNVTALFLAIGSTTFKEQWRQLDNCSYTRCLEATRLFMRDCAVLLADGASDSPMYYPVIQDVAVAVSINERKTVRKSDESIWHLQESLRSRFYRQNSNITSGGESTIGRMLSLNHLASSSSSSAMEEEQQQQNGKSSHIELRHCKFLMSIEQALVLAMLNAERLMIQMTPRVYATVVINGREVVDTEAAIPIFDYSPISIVDFVASPSVWHLCTSMRYCVSRLLSRVGDTDTPRPYMKSWASLLETGTALFMSNLLLHENRYEHHAGDREDLLSNAVEIAEDAIRAGGMCPFVEVTFFQAVKKRLTELLQK